MVPIPVAVTYTTTLSAHTPKHVRCEKCRFEYVYLLKVTVEGEGTSIIGTSHEAARERSRRSAEAALRQGLDAGVEVVPCRSCGHVQTHMLQRARDLHLRLLWIAGLVLLGAAGILCLPAAIYTLIDVTGIGISGATLALWGTVAASFAIGIAMILARKAKAKAYNPNDAPVEERKKTGNDLSVSKEEYQKILAAGER